MTSDSSGVVEVGTDPGAAPARLLPRIRGVARTVAGARQLRSDVALVLGSGLFDPEWYATEADCGSDPVPAARHFLVEGAALGVSPHPLFDPRHFTRRAGEQLGERNPLVAYLTDPKLRRVTTHPLFGFRNYMREHPESRKYPRGVTRHYLEVGARKGFAPNPWYRPDPAVEPEGLADWLRARRAEWVERQSAASSPWVSLAPSASGTTAAEPSGTRSSETPLVSVLLATGQPATTLPAVIRSVLDQDLSSLEVLIAHPEGTEVQVQADLVEATAGAGDARVRFVAVPSPDLSAAVSIGAEEAAAEWVAFCLPATVWLPHHLRETVGLATSRASEAAYDVVERAEEDTPTLYATGAADPVRSLVDQQIQLGALVVRRTVLAELGGIDQHVHCAAAHDLELKLVGRGAVPMVPRVGVRTSAELETLATDAVPLRERPRMEVEQLQSWHQVVIGRHLVDWTAAETTAPEPGLVSIIIPTHADSAMTIRAVERVAEAAQAAQSQWEQRGGAEDQPARPPSRVELIVVDNGCPPGIAAALELLPILHPGLRVLHQPVNRGYALANNLAVPHARGETIVFLNNDTEVSPGWLEPLVEALADPEVHGAQSLLVYPSGAIQSAGVAFPATGGIPHVLLQGFPVEDAVGLEQESFAAVTAAALAMRRRDVLDRRGFDPIFVNGMEDVDLGLRMVAARPGRFVVRPDSVVVHHESRAPGRFKRTLTNRRVLLDRHADALVSDDVRLWHGRGYDVVGHEIRKVVSEDRRVSVPEPVLTRRVRVDVHEGLPVLRWSLKNPAPWGPAGDRWGDTHFARQLAASLRGLGQEVVIDHRGEFERQSGRFDDVVLVLRGNAPYNPMFGQVSLAWLISHPEMFARREAVAYDRVFAASGSWAKRMSSAWGIRIDPLLQATDPSVFNPERGTPDTGHPLIFVGGSRLVLRPLVGAAIEQGLPLSIYGNHWDDIVPERFVKQDYLDNALVGEAYRRAGVVLNDHWEEMRLEGFISNRLFDAAASGARVVSDDIEGLDAIFGRSVQVARNGDELAALFSAPDLDLVFGDDAERTEVAKRISHEHSFDTRAATLLDVAIELRAGRTDARRLVED